MYTTVYTVIYFLQRLIPSVSEAFWKSNLATIMLRILMLTELVKLETVRSKSKRRIPVSKITWVIHHNFIWIVGSIATTFHPWLLEKKLHPSLKTILLASKTIHQINNQSNQPTCHAKVADVFFFRENFQNIQLLPHEHLPSQKESSFPRLETLWNFGGVWVPPHPPLPKPRWRCGSWRTTPVARMGFRKPPVRFPRFLKPWDVLLHHFTEGFLKYYISILENFQISRGPII